MKGGKKSNNKVFVAHVFAAARISILKKIRRRPSHAGIRIAVVVSWSW